jgi:hypothetical protein
MTTTLVAPAVEAAPPAALTMPDLTVVETERDVFARNRDKITAALRANGDRQITGTIADGAGGVCFVGCAVEALG